MSSFCRKRYLYNHLFVILFITRFITAKEHTLQPTEKASYNSTLQKVKGACKCGAFPNSEPKPSERPMFSETVKAVKCSPASRETCRKHCYSVAESRLTKPTQLNKLCATLKNVYELLLSAFYKLCDEPWRYCNLTMEEPICCEDGKPADCLLLGFKDF